MSRYIQNANKRSILRGHTLDRGNSYVMQDPVAHLVVEHAVVGVHAHAARIRAGVALANPLVILCRGKRHHVLAVGQGKERNFFAFEKLLNHDRRLNRAQQLSAQQARDRLGGLFL